MTGHTERIRRRFRLWTDGWRRPARRDDPARFPWFDLERPPEERLDRLLERMSLREKVHQLCGCGERNTGDNRRLGIPGFRCTDGTRGVNKRYPPATCFPVALARAATWDPELDARVARSIAREAAAKSRNVLLAPCVDVVRDPRWGRSQETFGEDPLLASRFGASEVRAIQAEGVTACVKHFVCHHQDTNRRDLDVRVDARALREVYAPAFRACVVHGEVRALMAAYNAVDGASCCQHTGLLRDLLREEWGFQGMVVSDWKATKSTIGSATAGLDLEMPRPRYYGVPLLRAVRSGRLPAGALDALVRRVLRVKLRAGLLDPTPPARPPGDVVDCAEHRDLARTVAREGAVLLKNEGPALPLTGARDVTILGPVASRPLLGDHGCSRVLPNRAVSLAEGLRALAGPNLVIRTPDPPADPERAGELVRDTDAAVVAVGLDETLEGENRDRRDGLGLPPEQTRLIGAVARAATTVVVVHAGGAVAVEDWVERVPAVLMAWYPGQEGGHALAEVLLGRGSPGGRLPLTFPRSVEQLAAAGSWPFAERAELDQGVFVGYRRFDGRGLEPRFPFGHGLTYTAFAYEDLRVTPTRSGTGLRVAVGVRVRNAGPVAGSAVPQLYLHELAPRRERPPQELKGFRKIRLEPGEVAEARFELTRADLASYDAARGAWTADPGEFELRVGESSRDIRARARFELPDDGGIG